MEKGIRLEFKALIKLSVVCRGCSSIVRSGEAVGGIPKMIGGFIVSTGTISFG